MSTQIQRRRGTTAEHSTFTGVEGELTVDTTKDTVVVHDGATTGGRPLLREDQANLPTSVTNGISVPSANNVAISTNGTGRLFIDSSGNVGVSTSTINSRLHIHSTGSTPAYLRSTNDSTGTGSTDGIVIGMGDATNAYLWNYEAGSIVFATSASERLRITSDGKLGLGTSAPSSIIEVYSGDALVKNQVGTNNSANPGIQVQHGGTINGSWRHDGRLEIGGQDSNAKIRLNPDGTVWIGGTLPASPNINLQENGNLYAGASIVATNDTTGLNWYNNIGLLRIQQESSQTGYCFDIYKGGTNATKIGFKSDGSAYFASNVGIGTTSPAQSISIGGLSSTPADFKGLAFQSGSTEVNYVRGVVQDGNNYALSFGTYNGGLSEKARLTAAGQLLVGTSTAFDTANTGTSWLVGIEKPSGYSALSIKTNEATPNGAYLNLGKSRGTTANSKAIVNNNDELGGVYFEGADGASMRVGARVAAFVDGTPGASDLPTRLVFSTTADGESSPTERMRIAQDGITTTYGDGSVIVASSAQAAGTTFSTFVGRYSATSTATGTVSFRVWTNGDVVNTNNSYGAISDIKLKENIVDANSQWDDLKALQVRNYNFKEGQTHTQIGLIAQEVELVSPGLVTESPDRDEDGNDLGTVTKSVNYSVLYMKAVKALQEAMERIEVLEAKVNALEGN